MDTTLIEHLKNPTLYDHPVSDFQLFETHISWVLLTGQYAYKIKKPVDFGFLDFSTLEKRKFCCEEEIRLNQRLAPHIYLTVVPISGSKTEPNLQGIGEPFEYAVKMVQFNQSQMLPKLLEKHTLTPELVDKLADTIAHFHATIPSTSEDSPYGSPKHVLDPVVHNFKAIVPLLTDPQDKKQLERHEAWAVKTHTKLQSHWLERKKTNKIRECHGDIHLGNIALVDDKITIFDCIEFNPSYYWVDVMSDLAFLVMDLQNRGLHEYANRLLNRYLERTGDYRGLALLPFFAAYRAMVRAKIAILRLNQPNLSQDEQETTRRLYLAYVNLAESYAAPNKGRLIIMHGVSGSGKSVLSQWLAEQLNAIRLRSDVERKRLFDLSAEENSQAKGLDIYTSDASTQTFQFIEKQAAFLCAQGFTVIIDATFLKRKHRAQFQTLAERLDIPFHIVSCETSTEQAKAWLLERQRSLPQEASEATVAILESQLTIYEAITEEEKAFTSFFSPSSGEAQQLLNLFKLDSVKNSKEKERYVI